jgi:hypothetical protein
MKQPTSEKNESMKQFIESVLPDTAKAISENRCSLCKEPIGTFRDGLYEYGYEISGMCQKCQDRIFGI